MEHFSFLHRTVRGESELSHLKDGEGSIHGRGHEVGADEAGEGLARGHVRMCEQHEQRMPLCCCAEEADQTHIHKCHRMPFIKERHVECHLQQHLRLRQNQHNAMLTPLHT